MTMRLRSISTRWTTLHYENSPNMWLSVASPAPLGSDLLLALHPLEVAAVAGQDAVLLLRFRNPSVVSRCRLVVVVEQEARAPPAATAAGVTQAAQVMKTTTSNRNPKPLPRTRPRFEPKMLSSPVPRPLLLQLALRLNLSHLALNQPLHLVLNRCLRRTLALPLPLLRLRLPLPPRLHLPPLLRQYP
mmetsp:Transcript_17945/g.42295  ORF Transcript_17945/g.42295 Transcript_17945/m.42295 type:complete len:188 (+) Transcript_17945:1935-2498(+)